MRVRHRHELGPLTLADVLAARAGSFRSEQIALGDRPLLDPRDERGMPLAVGQMQRADDDEPIIGGYATVYDRGYDMYGGPERGGWTEHVVAGAGQKSLAESPDVVHLENHTGRAFARTKSGTLELFEDKTGLGNRVFLAADDSRTADLLVSIDRGDIDEQSFAFRIARQEWNDDYTQRFITEYSISRGDTSHVTFGANPHTSIAARGDSQIDLVRVAVDRFLLDLMAAGDSDPLRSLRSLAPDLTVGSPAAAGRSLRLARIQAGLD